MTRHLDQETFLRLRDATLLVPTPDDADAGAWALVERDVLSVLMEEDDAGLLMAAFTTVEALAAWRPEGGAYVERSARWFFGVATADPEGRVAIDPGSPGGLVLDPRQVAALANGSDGPTASPSDGPVLVATPAEGLPTEVERAVRAALSTASGVVSARLLLIDSDGQGHRLVVMVELTDGLDADAIGATMEHIVGEIAEETDEAGGLTFAVVTDDWRDPYETGGLTLWP